MQVLFIWLIIEIIFCVIFYHICFQSIYDNLSEIRTNEYLKYNSSARGFGSGMVRREIGIGVDNATSSTECKKIAKNALHLPNKFLKIRALFVIYVMALIPSVIVTIFVVLLMHK